MSFTHLRSVVCVLFASISVGIVRADVTVLGKPELGSFTTIQGAGDAASEGDVLLVTAGSYAAFVFDGKGLTIVGLGTVNISGTCEIRNLAPNRVAALVHLNITGQNVSWYVPTALVLTSDLGHVRVQDCALTGGLYYSGFYDTVGGNGASVTGCPRVVFAHCTLTGRSIGYISGEYPAAGGDGLGATNSAVTLYDCTLRGGTGSEETYPSGGVGGSGARVNGWGVFASGCTLRGGTGGGGDYIGCTTSGDGGNGLTVTDAQARLLDNAITPGLAGNFGPCGLGQPGQAIESNGGIVTQIPGTRRSLTGPATANDNSTVTFTFTGLPGDGVWLLKSRTPAYQFKPNFIGLISIPWPWLMTVQPMGTIGPSGVLGVNLTISDSNAPEAGWIWYLQGLCIDTAGTKYLATPAQILVFNP